MSTSTCVAGGANILASPHLPAGSCMCTYALADYHLLRGNNESIIKHLADLASQTRGMSPPACRVRALLQVSNINGSYSWLMK